MLKILINILISPLVFNYLFSSLTCSCSWSWFWILNLKCFSFNDVWFGHLASFYFDPYVTSWTWFSIFVFNADAQLLQFISFFRFWLLILNNLSIPFCELNFYLVISLAFPDYHPTITSWFTSPVLLTVSSR